MQEQPREVNRSPRRNDPILLAALLLLSIAVGLALLPRGQVALADLLFQSPPTNTPDPNSPLPTPTPTWTPFPTDTPTPVETPTDTPTPQPNDTPTPFPTDTPFVFPTDTPFVFPTDTPFAFPTDTPFELPTDTPPPLAPQPTFTPGAMLAPPAPPVEPAQTEPLTLTLEIIDVLPLAAAGERAAEPAAEPRRLDAALFIDNLVIAFGYVWMCFGALTLMAAALGGFWLWRRRAQPPAQRVPDPGPAPAPPLPAGPENAPPPPAPPPTRVAARRSSSPPPQDLD